MDEAVRNNTELAARMTAEVVPGPIMMSPSDRAALETAVRRLQNSRGLIVRGADLLASMVGSAAALGWRGMRISPATVSRLRGIAEVALRRAFDVAVLGVENGAMMVTSRQSGVIAAVSGAVGGFIGFAGFLLDATLTTLLVMRNVAEIAREEGEDLADAATRQACLEVFAFGSPSLDNAEEGDAAYWSARLVMHGRPLTMIFSEVAGRYGLRISEKFAAQAVPIIGAAGGALVNTVFLNHYRNLARVHFTIRRLERQYGGVDIHQAAVEMARSMRMAA